MRLRTWLPPILDGLWLAVIALVLAWGIGAVRAGEDFWGAGLIVITAASLKPYFRHSFTDAAKANEPEAEPDAGQVA